MGNDQTVNGQAMAIIAVSAILSFLAILAVIFRFAARTYKGSRYYVDDYLIVGALIITLGVTINNIVGVAVAGFGEHENFHTSGPHNGFPLEKDLVPQGRVTYALQILHTRAMPVIKASVLAFYTRLFPTRRLKYAVVAVLAYVFCWWVSTFFVTVVQCHPVSSNWGTEPGQLGGCLHNINVFYETAAILNLGDIFVLALPFPIIVRLQMGLKHKIAILDWYYLLVIWTSVEPTLGVISACLPTLRPLFAGFSPETVLDSIRSVFTLQSLHGKSPTHESPHENRQPLSALPSATSKSRSSGGGFFKLADRNGSSKENQHVAMELNERKTMQEELPCKRIAVQEDLDQKVVRVAHEMV